ncbi:MAG: hypothetical protein NT175_11730 [Bacteroidetes bacterium]|nr:hypothetical protein [Bacteroidota bacterium]
MNTNHDTIYKYVNCYDGLRLLYKKSLKFSKSKNFNDPFDCYVYLIDFKPQDVKDVKEIVDRKANILDPDEIGLTHQQLMEKWNQEGILSPNNKVFNSILEPTPKSNHFGLKSCN